MSIFVLDTHAWVWWVHAPEKLGKRARPSILRATELAIPSIVFWEVALLVERRRLRLGMSARQWVDTVLSIPRVREVALTALTAVAASSLQMHADPADRFIAATALALGVPLISRDEALKDVADLSIVW
jgi:PIN domain nuclease of toxin-antitoxin system